MSLASPAGAADIDEFKVKRQEVFEFTEKPALKRDGDKIEIHFASKAFCDATAAIEDANGRIVRHLASGVLGPRAPEPFQKDSLSQTIVWDGKDDKGAYVVDRPGITVRVSLGLAPRFERTLYWTPYKRITQANLPIMRACPEGVLVYEGQIYDSIRLFDHQGNYVRTVYPFPRDKVESFKDLQWSTAPQDGAKIALKQWFRQASLLTSGDNSNHPFRGFGEQRMAHDGHGASAGHHAASAMAVRGNRVALAMHRLNRLALDGSSGDFGLEGPNVSYETLKGGYYHEESVQVVRPGPTGAAFSPDGQWVYLTGYQWISLWGTGGRKNYFLPGVVRAPFEGAGEATVFAGSVKKDEEGNDNAHFTIPTSVATDAKGRVYVSDYMNDRVQVYQPDGRFYKTVAVKKPAQVAVHQRTGDIYVFRWVVGNWRLQASKEPVKSQIVRLGPLDAPVKPEEYDIPLIGYGEVAGAWLCGLQYAAELDSWADQPTFWLYPGSYVLEGFSGYQGELQGRPYWRTSGIQVLTIKDGRLVVQRDFGAQAAKEVRKTSRVAGTNRNLCVNPVTGKLYVGDGSSGEGFSWSLSIEFDAETGESRMIDLPFDCEQMQFDTDGLVYLRARGYLVRYDPAGWREVPWDYGEEHEKIATASSQNFGPGFRPSGQVNSAVVVPYWEHAPNGVFSISPKGNIVIPIKGRATTVGTLPFRKTEETSVFKGKPYEFQLYPGRSVSGLVLVLDKTGREVYDDAIPGLTYTHGIKIDNDDSLYALALANRVLDGKPYFNAAAGTLMKFKPRKARIVATHKDAVPVPMTPEQTPKRPPDILGGGKTGIGQGWVEGAEWFYGGVGYNGEHHKNPDYGCDCCFSSFDLDAYARSFAPEVDHYSVAVLDSNGNLILRVGRYGNVDDGQPLVAQGGPARTQVIGGDEVALFHAPHVAVHSDRRLFIADVGNERILSVKLDYHATERVGLKAGK